MTMTGAALALGAFGCGGDTPPPVAETPATTTAAPAPAPAKVAKSTGKPGSKKIVVPDEDTSFHLRKKKLQEGKSN